MRRGEEARRGGSYRGHLGEARPYATGSEPAQEEEEEEEEEGWKQMRDRIGCSNPSPCPWWEGAESALDWLLGIRPEDEWDDGLVMELVTPEATTLTLILTLVMDFVARVTLTVTLMMGLVTPVALVSFVPARIHTHTSRQPQPRFPAHSRGASTVSLTVKHRRGANTVSWSSTSSKASPVRLRAARGPRSGYGKGSVSSPCLGATPTPSPRAGRPRCISSWPSGQFGSRRWPVLYTTRPNSNPMLNLTNLNANPDPRFTTRSPKASSGSPSLRASCSSALLRK